MKTKHIILENSATEAERRTLQKEFLMHLGTDAKEIQVKSKRAQASKEETKPV